MARRKREDIAPRRTARLAVRLTPAELDDVRGRAAKIFGRANVADYARLILLDDWKNPPPSARDPHAIRELAVAIRKVGTNINQLAHVANAKNDLPAERDLRRAVQAIIEALEKVQAL